MENAVVGIPSENTVAPSPAARPPLREVEYSDDSDEEDNSGAGYVVIPAAPTEEQERQPSTATEIQGATVGPREGEVLPTAAPEQQQGAENRESTRGVEPGTADTGSTTLTTEPTGLRRSQRVRAAPDFYGHPVLLRMQSAWQHCSTRIRELLK